MKSVLKYIVQLTALLTVFSCDAGLADSGIDDLEIRLGAGVPGTVIMTKSGPVDFDTYLPDNISLIRWDAGDDTNPGNYTFEQALSATIGQPDPADEWKRYVNFEKSQYFVNRTDAVGFAACYPSVKDPDNGWTKEGSVLTYNIFEGDDVDVMVSDFKSGTYTSGIDPLHFQHALCLYNIYVYAVDEQAAVSWGDIKNITFINLPEELYVTLPTDMTDPDASVSLSYSPKPDDDQYRHQRLFDTDQNIDLPVGINNKKKIGYKLGGPPAIGLLGISAETVNDENSTSPISIARNFQPGYIYNLVLKFSEHGVINAELTVEEWWHDEIEYDAEMEEANRFLTNLSRYGTANTYIAASGNMGYCFDATVKGNGFNKLTDWEGNVYVMPDASVTLNPVYVKVLHSEVLLKYDAYLENYVSTTSEERENLQILSLRTEKLVDGYALFDIDGVEGAEYTDYTLPYMGNAVIAAYNAADEIIWTWHIWITDRPYNVNLGNGYVVQDRNLGACSSSDAYDPLTVRGLYYQWGRRSHMHLNPSVVSGPLTMNESHNYPGYLISSDTDDWLKTNYDYLWGYVAERVDVVKTIYDPCPSGYRVSDSNTFRNLTIATTTKNPDDDGYTLNAGEYDIYFPDPDPDKKDTPPRLYSAAPSGTGKSYAYEVSETGVSPVSTSRKEKMNVRCIVENSAPVVYNLDENQSASCHLIENPGYYRFDAQTLGNGVRGFNVVLSQGNISVVYIDNGYHPDPIVKVDVLSWQGDVTTGSDYMTFSSVEHSTDEIETACPVKMLDGGVLTEGNAYYYISNDTFASGNVILAGYDSNDNIVWTWHIWLVPGGVGEEKWGNYTVLDRNLGATWRPASPSEVNADNMNATVGFYYQWGRKDPFPMTSSDGSLYAPMYLKNNGVWTKVTEISFQNAATIDESVRKPYVYFNGTDYWQTSWTNVIGTSLPLRNIWGYTGVEGTIGDTFVKTMWDPCPAGYKVGSHEVVSGWNTGANNEYGQQSMQVSTVSQSYGMYMEAGTNSTSKWLPKTGRIQSNGILVDTAYGYLGSSCSYANGERYRGLYYNQNSQGYYTVGHNENSNHCYAVPVRCVRE